jgi:hypothetical protein
MFRTLLPIVALSLSATLTIPAHADEAKDKSAAVVAEAPAQPKIRVILPALWEPATPPSSATQQAQRNAAR